MALEVEHHRVRSFCGDVNKDGMAQKRNIVHQRKTASGVICLCPGGAAPIC
jgi:hypothetical protein